MKTLILIAWVALSVVGILLLFHPDPVIANRGFIILVYTYIMRKDV